MLCCWALVHPALQNCVVLYLRLPWGPVWIWLAVVVSHVSIGLLNTSCSSCHSHRKWQTVAYSLFKSRLLENSLCWKSRIWGHRVTDFSLRRCVYTRRAHLKECFETLKRNVPNVDEKKTSNLSVLRSALRYIQVSRPGAAWDSWPRLAWQRGKLGPLCVNAEAWAVLWQAQRKQWGEWNESTESCSLIGHLLVVFMSGC